MKFIAEVEVMPLKELLDPQGKAVEGAMQNLKLIEVKDVRVGKHIQLHIEAGNETLAKEIAETACKKLLANPVMESYHFSIHSV